MTETRNPWSDALDTAYQLHEDKGAPHLIEAAHTAISEAIRIRREVEELRAETERGIEAYEGTMFALYLKQQHRAITRILGDTE